MFSRRLLIFALFTFSLMLLGAGLRIPYLTAVGLGMASIPIFSFFDFFSSLEGFRSLSAERVVPKPHAIKGGHIGVRLRVSNRSRVLLRNIRVQDSFPKEDFKPRFGDSVRTISLKPFVQAVFGYFLRAEREGAHSFKYIDLSMADRLGFFQIRRRLREVDRIVVFPTVAEVRESVIEHGKAHRLVSVGDHRSDSKGVSTEYMASREYVPGDELHFMDWKATARTGRPIIREFEAQTGSVCIALVDCGQSMLEGGKMRKIDYLKRGVVLLAREALGRGDFFGMLVPSISGIVLPERVSRYLHPGVGIGQFYSVIELVSHIKAFGIPDFLRALRFLEGRIRAPVNLFLITDLEDFGEKRIHDTIERATTLGYLVTVISPYTPLFHGPSRTLGERRGFTVVVSMEILEGEREVRLERIKELRAMGAEVVEVGPSDFFPSILSKYLLMRAKRAGEELGGRRGG